MQGPVQTVGSDVVNIAPERNEPDNGVRWAVNRARLTATNREHPPASEPRLDVDLAQSVVKEQRDNRHLVIDSPTPRTNDGEVSCTSFNGVENRQFGVGLVLVGWMPHDRGAEGRQRSERGDIQRIKVTHHRVDGETENVGKFCTRIGCNHPRWLRQSADARRVDHATAQQDDC